MGCLLPELMLCSYLQILPGCTKESPWCPELLGEDGDLFIGEETKYINSASKKETLIRFPDNHSTLGSF